VRWHVEPANGKCEPILHVEWKESGVDMETLDPSARGGGYGRELIENALPYQLAARTSYALGPDGVCCKIAVVVPAAKAGQPLTAS